MIIQQKNKEGKKSIVEFVFTAHIAYQLAGQSAIVPGEKQQASPSASHPAGVTETPSLTRLHWD